jgi:L-threonylcarbamoyladenylate synthase
MPQTVSKNIIKAVTLLKKGGAVVFPTETVYGLGALAFNKKAVKKIFKIKGRPGDNPLIVHIGDIKQLNRLTDEIPPESKKLIQKFWPGPLTLVFKKRKKVPSIVTAGLKTVAVRMPSHPIALRLLKILNEPVAAPSANRSGRPSPTRYLDVVQELGDRADFILDGGNSKHGLESTVLDVTKKPFRVLRHGSISEETLKKICPDIFCSVHLKSKQAARSPGMKHRHYVPNCTVLTIKPNRWVQTIQKYKDKNARIGVLSFSKKIPKQKNIVFIRKLNRSHKKYAQQLYSTFFEAERSKIDLLFVESISERGIGSAIMDRIKRASAKK